MTENTISANEPLQPLAERMRPSTIDEVVGQSHLTNDGMPLARMCANGKPSSMILWGPPGTGKTTLARILSEGSKAHFCQLSAVFAGVKDLKEVFAKAKVRREQGEQTLLFVDEIHRFMKSQQDAFLPVIEDGTIILIGATTENPSFELNRALLSRCQVLTLNRLSSEALLSLLERVEEKLEICLPLTEDARNLLVELADGDGRYVLCMLEQVLAEKGPVDEKSLLSLIQKRAPLYDKKDDAHYNLISALHKSVRGSDPDAALYWFSRMIESGEDPNFIARRMTRMASEDIGLADPSALTQCLNAWDAYERLGSPEGELALAQALIYLATAPKSIAVYRALKDVQRLVKKTGSLSPPMHILNAPTKLMKEKGYGGGYVYDPDTKESFSGQNYFPQELGRPSFYQPVQRGFEREINKRLAYWHNLRIAKNHKIKG